MADPTVAEITNALPLEWRAVLYAWFKSTEQRAIAATAVRALLGSYLDIEETAEPAAPAANTARLFVQDSGGKTQLMVRFPTGASQQLAIEL